MKPVTINKGRSENTLATDKIKSNQLIDKRRAVGLHEI